MTRDTIRDTQQQTVVVVAEEVARTVDVLDLAQVVVRGVAVVRDVARGT
jgi:hypothetical protein